MIAYIATTSIGNNATAQNNILFFDHRKVNGDTEETLERCGWGASVEQLLRIHDMAREEMTPPLLSD